MTGILITARVGSSRLPQKHFIEVNGKHFIEWLILRLSHVFINEIKSEKVKIVIATSVKPENKKFEKKINSLARVFYGDDENIPLRHLQCAKHFEFSNVISVDGDDILCSAKGAYEVYKTLNQDSKIDICRTMGLPLGMNILGYRVDYLDKCMKGKEKNKLETGWGRIFNNPREKKIKMGDYSIHSPLRFTLDYQDDATFFSTIINDLKEKIISISDEDLIKFVEQKRYFKINSHLSEQYWKNYNELKEQEQKNEQ
jgi:spore coat polysaccharide biosynthesis protein SpsF (cytidylyltransferase family)